MGSDLPAPGNFHCPRKLSVPRRVQGFRITDPLALPVRANPIVAHGVGVPSNHSTAELSI